MCLLFICCDGLVFLKIRNTVDWGKWQDGYLVTLLLCLSIYFIWCYPIWAQDTHLLLTGGMEKILRIFDLNRPDAPPREVDRSPGSVRTVAWLHSDQTILSTCTDMGGVRYECFFCTMFNATIVMWYSCCLLLEKMLFVIFASFSLIPFTNSIW